MNRSFGKAALAVVLLAAAIISVLAYQPANAESTVSLTVDAIRLNVRQGPGTNYAVKTVVSQGDTATAIGRNAAGDWFEVQLANGSTGWLSAAYVRPNGDASSVPEAAAPARTVARAPVARIASGSHIVFQTSSGGAIYIMNPNGSGLRQLTTGMDPALSPDGRQVAFTRWDGSGNGALGSVWVINVDGTAERQVLGFVAQPKSPTKQDNHWEVHVLNADGSGDTRLTETPLTTIVNEQLQGQQAVQWNNAAPAWSPDGSQIAFLTDRNGQWEIWAMNADGSNQHPLLSGSAAAQLQIQYNGVDERVLSWR